MTILNKIDNYLNEAHNLNEGVFSFFNTAKEVIKISNKIIKLQKNKENKNINVLIKNGLYIINSSKLDFEQKEKFKKGFLHGLWDELKNQLPDDPNFQLEPKYEKLIRLYNQ